MPEGVSDISVSVSAVEASIDSQGALIKTSLGSLISFSVKSSGVPVPDGGLEAILGEGGISGVVNDIVADSVTSMLVVGSSGDLDGASSLVSNTVTRVAVSEVVASAFVFFARGEFFHIMEASGFFSDLTEESRDSSAGVDVTPGHSLVEVGEIGGKVSTVG